jgi:hypothetical protein
MAIVLLALGTVILWSPFTWFIRLKNASTTQATAPLHTAAAGPPPAQ